MEKPSFTQLMKDPKALAVVWFGSGLSPVAPGTAGTLAGLLCAIPLHYVLGPIPLLIAGLILFAVGIFFCDEYIRKYDRAGDPQEAVIDEVAAMWIVLAFTPLNPWFYFLSFILFRIFDIVKPWPVSIADQHVKGGLGVMLDDLLAAGYAIFVGQILFALLRAAMQQP